MHCCLAESSPPTARRLAATCCLERGCPARTLRRAPTCGCRWSAGEPGGNVQLADQHVSEYISLQCAWSPASCLVSTLNGCPKSCALGCRLLRACGAFFIRRTSRGAPDSHLYKAVLAGALGLLGAGGTTALLVPLPAVLACCSRSSSGHAKCSSLRHAALAMPSRLSHSPLLVQRTCMPCCRRATRSSSSSKAAAGASSLRCCPWCHCTLCAQPCPVVSCHRTGGPIPAANLCRSLAVLPCQPLQP